MCIYAYSATFSMCAYKATKNKENYKDRAKKCHLYGATIATAGLSNLSLNDTPPVTTVPLKSKT